jgi:hypothetical protein
MEQLQPEKAAILLRKQGMDVTIEEAGLILEFLRKLAAIAVKQCLGNENCRYVHKGEHG